MLGVSPLKNVFSATANGFGRAFYQSKEFTVLQDSYAFKFKDKNIKIEKIHSFIIGSLNKIYSKYDWGNKSGWKKVKQEKIKLPITAGGAINFSFMEKFIAELEAYLITTGLKNHHLSKEEEKALQDCDTMEWREFRIGDLFDVATGRDIIIGKTLNGKIPLISHQHQNNGISKYITELSNRRLFDFKKTLSLADRGVFLATAQNEKFHIGTRVKALTFKGGEQTKKSRLFFVSAINKLQILFTDYSDNATDTLPDLKIQLPITKNGDLHFPFMQTLISAIQKLVIQEVVLFADRKIQATQRIVNPSC